MTQPTAARVRELLTYDETTGEFRWRVRRQGARQDVHPGYIESGEYGGYWRIKIDGRLCYAHQLAWLYMTGQWPALEVDHKNNNRTNNCWSNLRLATSSQNKYNGRMHNRNKAGLKGIYERRGGYRAVIKYEGRHRHLGDFATAEQAHAAYCRAADDLFGEFARAS